MAQNDMKLDVLVNLKDHMSGGLSRLNNSISKTASAARKIGAVGAAISGLSFIGPMREAASFQEQLLDVASTMGLSGDAAFKAVDQMREQYEDLAFKVGQSSVEIAKSSQILNAAGLDGQTVSASLESIGLAATASGSSIEDMSNLGVSLLQNLKIPASELKDTLGALAVAGKEGSFELADMAREFPQLTAGFANLGVTGRGAANDISAMLQVIRRGTSTSSEAATNLKSLVSEVQSPMVVKNFKKMGVDIQAVMKDAVGKGINPLEAAVAKAGKISGVSANEVGKYMDEARKHGLKGADAVTAVREKLEKLGRAGGLSRLFGNIQSRDAVVAWLANIEEYKRVKEEVSKATADIIDKDAATRMRGFSTQMQILSMYGRQFGRDLGIAFNNWLPTINKGLSYLLSTYKSINEKTDGLLSKILGFGAAAALVATGIGALGIALPIVAAGFSAVGAIITVLASPIALVIGALAGAGALIYKNWDKIAPSLKKFWGGIKDASFNAWNGIKSAWAKAMPYLKNTWNNLSQAATDAFARINWDNIGTSAVYIYQEALDALKNAWDWTQRLFEGFKPWLKSIGETLKGAFDSFMGSAGNIKIIAGGLWSLAKSLGRLLGLGDKENGTPTFLGDLAGGIARLGAGAIKAAAVTLQTITGAIAALIKWCNGESIDWEKLFPKDIVNFVAGLADNISRVGNGIKRLFGYGNDKKSMAYQPTHSEQSMQNFMGNAYKPKPIKPAFSPSTPDRGNLAQPNNTQLPPPNNAQNMDVKVETHLTDERTVQKTYVNDNLKHEQVNAGTAIGRP